MNMNIREFIEDKKKKMQFEQLHTDKYIKLFEKNGKDLETLMTYYECALMEIETKLKVLNAEFELTREYSPIETIKSRLKSLDSLDAVVILLIVCAGLLAIVVLFIYGLVYGLLSGSTVGYYALYAILLTARLSVSLGIFNLIPVPPLDGSKVLFALLPQRWYYTLMRYEKYGSVIMIVLVLTGVLTEPLTAAVKLVFGGLSFFSQWGAALAGLI